MRDSRFHVVRRERHVHVGLTSKETAAFLCYPYMLVAYGEKSEERAKRKRKRRYPTMRQRRKEDPQAAGDEMEPLDKDEQAAIIASLQEEGTGQIQRANKIFSLMCALAAAMTVAFVLIDGKNVRHVGHGVYALVVHWLARTHATMNLSAASETTQPFPRSKGLALLIGLALSPLVVLASFSASLDSETLHWSIALATLLIAICSILLRLESSNTMSSLEALKGSTYNYKSL